MDLVQIKDILWNGSINVKITLYTETQSLQYLVKVYRNSYFPSIFSDVLSYFAEDLPVLPTSPIWLEYEDVPIKWNLPIGVLHDYLHIKPQDPIWCLTLKYGPEPYPWEFIVPFQYRLENDYIDYQKSLKEIAMNQMKQAVFILNGNSKPIMTLDKSTSNNFFTAIEDHNLVEFARINSEILNQIKIIKKLPIKIYIPGTNQLQSPILSENMSTLQDLLDQYPLLFSDSLAIPVIQGIDASSLLLVDLKQIWYNFKLIDNFLHVIFIVK